MTDLTRGKSADRNVDAVLEFLGCWRPEVKLTLEVKVSGTGGAALGEILHLVTALRAEVKAMATDLDTLTTEVAEIGDVVDSAITLIKGIAEQLKAAGTDPAKLRALATQLDQKAGDLARAVAENTPEPTDGPPPEDPPVDPSGRRR